MQVEVELISLAQNKRGASRFALVGAKRHTTWSLQAMSGSGQIL